MRVNRVNNVSFITRPIKIHNSKNISDSNKKSIVNSLMSVPVYYGKDIVSFGKEFKETIEEKYFHLPQGCSPDEFQIEAGKEISLNKNVIVEAPTGTGKTAIAHYAVSKNMSEGKTTFYTTPLKALSNQKLNEFRAVYGDENVGILTGDRRENVNAPIIIMTTEVYRNMALSDAYGEHSDLMDNLGSVIFDECHYMGDYSRGSAWEESIIYTPENVQILALSATIGNANQIQSWIKQISDKPVSLVSIPSSKRHVPLEFDIIETNAYKTEAKKIQKANKNKGTIEVETDGRIAPKPALSDFKYAVNFLMQKGQLPAIFFIFSKKFSKELLDYLEVEGPVLTTKEEQKEIEKIIHNYKSQKYIGNNLNINVLKKGYAIHNAGIIPAQKELIEELFQKKLIKTVLATETLAAGINMPAKTVVMSSAYKPSDIEEEDDSPLRVLTPNEFKQMSGRAGRRGIDTKGYVYTMPTNMATEQEFLMLEVLEANPLESRYIPDYSFLTEYYKYNPDEQGLSDIYSKTFYSYSEDEQELRKKVEQLLQLSSNKTEVLKEREFIISDESGIKLTPKGEMASNVRGYDALTLTEAVSDGIFKDVTPEVLAMTAGAIANPPAPKEPEITPETDLSYVFGTINKSVDILKKDLITSINRKLSYFGKNIDDFASLQDLLTYVKALEVPQGHSVFEVKEKLDALADKKAKIYKIQSTSGKLTPQELVTALKRGETISTKILQESLEEVEAYKKRINSSDIDNQINKIQNALDELNAASKSKKAQSRLETKREELYRDLERANAMKYLDENLYRAINDNFNFIKQNPPSQIKSEYIKQSELYARLTSIQKLLGQIQGITDIENYNLYRDIQIDNDKNSQTAQRCFNELTDKELQIYSVEARHGINRMPKKYGQLASKVLYMWTYLNKINSSTRTNWKLLLKSIPDEVADEGTIYRQIMQTADLLSQINDIAKTGLKFADTPEQKDYYSHLSKTAQEARNLIIKDPVTV